MQTTVIEYRDPKDKKLKELAFDETEFYIQRRIDWLKEEGAFDFAIVENPNNFKLNLPSHTASNPK